ncbi:MAG TPA: bifunctional pyr operon transcriptional regulator/uracil phosphoribosyltransferase PyrR [Advenella kashmirensis]|uniref:Bifunctional pyr operon transcriptional regulator/uracil phosphoribosyltransferase PyrR n=1 Tax=Advenella kashmirensis TaxID=310575 RepID=A0A356LD90_9BURK|nr:bifunctional pyr operon transcriptional regulator/uracil phosphoribosyltransferase PyrR [Advenella kashmirensis]
MTGSLPSAEELYAHLKNALSEKLRGTDPANTYLVGIYSGGAWLARRLCGDLNLPNQPGTLNTSLHRDDFSRIGLHSQTQPSHVPFEVEGAHIFLIDDILFTGRTIRAALNELYDYGRPASVRLGVLIDRGGRELPIAPDICGGVLPLPRGSNYVLAADDDSRFTLTLEEEPRHV